MKIQPINCQTSFGVKYVGKEVWSIYAVDAIKRLSVVKAIKKKYPNATFIFDSITGGTINNTYHCYSLHIFIDSQTEFSVSASNYSLYAAMDSILSQLKCKKLEDIENEMHCIQQSDSKGHEICRSHMKIF